MENSKGKLSEIKPLLTSSPYRPFRYVANGIESEINQFWYNKIADSLKIDSSQLMEVISSNGLDGFIVINDLPWDSNIF